MWAWYCVGYRHAEDLLLTSLQVSADIHVFFLDSWALGLGMDLRRAENIPSPLAGVVRGQRGGPRAPPKLLGVFPQVGAMEAS